MTTRNAAIQRHVFVLLMLLVCAASVVAADALIQLPQFGTLPVRIPETIQRVTSLQFSPDGKYLLSGHGSSDRSGSFQIWEVATGRRVAMRAFPTGISSVGWMPTGDRFAVTVWDNAVRVFDFPSLRQATEFKIDRSVGYLAIAPDGKRIVTAAEGQRDADESPGRVVQIWDAKTGEMVRKCDSDETLFRLGCAAWSPQGKYVAAAGGYYSRQIGLGQLWIAETGKEAGRLEGHTGYIREIRFFPDDLQIATSGFDGTVRIWESATGKQVARFFVGSMVDGLDVSSDGTMIASGGGGGEITLWSAEKQQKIADLSKTGSAVHSVALSRNSKLLASGSADGIVRIWSVADKTLLRELPLAGSDDRPGAPQAIASLADGQVAVVGYDTGLLMATDVTRQSKSWRVEAVKGKSPTAMAVSADQEQLLVGYEDGAVRLHSTADGKVQAELKKLPARVSSVAFDVESGWLAAGDSEGEVWLWEQQGKVHREERQDHRGPVLALAFGDKGRAIVSVGVDGKAIRRRTNSAEILAEARISTVPLTSATISQDGSTAVVLGQQLTVWNTLQLTRRSEAPIVSNARNTVAISPDGALVVFGHALGTSMFDGAQEGQIEPVRTTNSREGGLLAMSSDRRTLLQATSGGALLAWHSLPPKVSPLGQIARAGNAVALATSPDGKWLVSGGDDSQATVWDLATGEIVETLPGNFGTMYAIAFSADSEFMATANMTGTVKVWRVKDWSLEAALLNPQRQVRCVAFSPNGRWLASGGNDRKLLITDTQSWETAVEKPDQDLWVEGVAFSPDGSRLYTVTGSWDPKDQPVASTLTAWKVTAGKDKLELEPIKKIAAHGGTTDNLVVTPDGRHVITAGADSLIKVWDAKTLAMIRSIKLPAGAHRLHLLRSDPAQVMVGDHLGGASVWNVQTGLCLANYAGHTSHVFDVSATKDGRLLISASEDDRILFWPGPNRGPDAALKKFLKNAADEKTQ
jgi:WD40 repeat protein